MIIISTVAKLFFLGHKNMHLWDQIMFDYFSVLSLSMKVAPW